MIAAFRKAPSRAWCKIAAVIANSSSLLHSKFSHRCWPGPALECSRYLYPSTSPTRSLQAASCYHRGVFSPHPDPVTTSVYLLNNPTDTDAELCSPDWQAAAPKEEKRPWQRKSHIAVRQHQGKEHTDNMTHEPSAYSQSSRYSHCYPDNRARLTPPSSSADESWLLSIDQSSAGDFISSGRSPSPFDFLPSYGSYRTSSLSIAFRCLTILRLPCLIHTGIPRLQHTCR